MNSDMRSTPRSHRQLLVFADTPRDPELVELVRQAERSRSDCMDRELVTRVFLGEQESAVRMRHALQVPSRGFCALLVGKDGTEKRRYPAAPALENVFALIDTMPMRRRELRVRSGSLQRTA